MNKYKKLFEGRFTKTHNYTFNLFEKIYYNLSPSTYNEKRLFNNLKIYLKTSSEHKILDIGCGGGHKYLTPYGSVYGIDISAKSLANAKKIYKEVQEADCTKKIPYKNNYFDVIFCSEVFGHIDKNDKEAFINEVNRVLKPGGYLFFSIETKGNNILTNYLFKKKLYEKLWIDHQGHIGLEKPSDTINRFKKHFTILNFWPTSGHILPIDGYDIFEEQFPIYKIFRLNILRRIANIFLSPIFYLVLKLSPFDSANDIVLVMKKE